MQSAAPDFSVYWASETDPKRLVQRAHERYSRHLARLQATGRLERARQVVLSYYGYGTDGMKRTNRLMQGGEQGEVTVLSHNALRPTVRMQLGLVAGTRPGVKPVATNDGAVSQEQTRTATALRGYFDKHLNCEEIELDVTLGGILASSWSLVQEWDSAAGEDAAFDPDTQQPVPEGDVRLHSVPPWRIAYDLTAHRVEDRAWCIFRRRVPRFDVVARLERKVQRTPEGEEREEVLRAIERLRGEGAALSPWGTFESQLVTDMQGVDDVIDEWIDTEDACWLWEVRHLPSPSLPTGRLVVYLDEDTVLYDSLGAGAYPYEGLHAYEYAPERRAGSTTGHTGVFDLLALQELLDICTTSAATGVNTYGMQHLWAPPGEAPVPRQISGGPTILEMPVKPEPVEYPALKPEVMALAEQTQKWMREGAAINDVVAGQPDKNMPAQAQALMRAQAVEFNRLSQRAYAKLVENNATGILRLSKRFANTSRTAEVVGEGGEYAMLQWSQADVAGVERFAVEVVDPAAQGYDGRVAMADKLLERFPGIVTPEGYVSMLETGRLKEAYEARVSSRELAQKHKALLRKGIGLPPVDMRASMPGPHNPRGEPMFLADGQPHVRPLKSDPHWLLVPEYLTVLASPEARTNDAVVRAVTGVVQESLRLWAQLTPDELVAFGGHPLPSQMALAAPPPEAGASPGKQHESQPPKGQLAKDMPDGGPGVRLPRPPANPLSGAREGTGALGGVGGAS